MTNAALVRVLRTNLRRALRSGALEQADELIARLKNEDPLAVETRGLELEYLIATKRWTEAANLATQLLALFSSSARIHYLAARIYYRNKDYLRALHHFSESERIHGHWRTQRWLGKTHTQLAHYEEAEALLLELQSAHAAVRLDLAWLYERRGEPERALSYVEEHLAQRPADSFAQSQRLRLRAQALTPGELMAEVDTLFELEEAVPPEMLSTYVQRLLETGQGAVVRRFIAERESQLDPRAVASMAWVCHRLHAYDIALRLFLLGLATHIHDYKYLSALESAAVQCRRVEQVVDAYETLAPQHRPLYGRIKALNRRKGDG
jgi:tetratricopeptide (TPR) repeat protein